MPADAIPSRHQFVVMIFSRKAADDPRVFKEARALVAAGYTLTVIDWDRHLTSPAVETVDGINVEHIHIPSRYDAGARQAPRMAGFLWRAFARLWRLRPAIVHSHDLETTPPALLYARLSGARFVFEAREYYPGMMAPKVPDWMAGMLRRLDDVVAPRADALLTIGERLAEHYRQRGARSVSIVGNYPPAPSADLTTAAQALRARLGIPPQALVVGYVGILDHERDLISMIEAVRGSDQWHAIVAGYGAQAEAMEVLAGSLPNFRFLGRVPLAEVLTVFTAADVIYYGLKSDNRNHYFSTPNTLFNAMAAGRPLLTTAVGEVSDIVAREGIGLVVAEASAETLRAGLNRLADPARRGDMAARARRLGQTRYHWDVAAETLLNAYRALDAGR